jgi:hypothetical protein
VATLSRVSADGVLDGGSTVRVDIRRQPGIFGIGKFWSGSISGKVKVPGASSTKTFFATGITGDSVVKPVPGSCTAVTINIQAVETSVFPWQVRRLVVTLDSASPQTAAVSLGSAKVPVQSAQGPIAIG